MNRKLIFYFVFCLASLIISPAGFSQSFSELNATVPPDTTIDNVQRNTQGNDLFDNKTDYAVNLDPAQGMDPAITKAITVKEHAQFTIGKQVNDKNSTYTLGPTDVIEITVLRHPEVSGKYILNTEGKIQYEFIGDVVLSGKTKEEAVDVLAKTLSTYIVNPQVTVKISEYNSKIVYVVGEVARPGRIIMRGDTITVREALLEAGLPLLTANTTHSTMFTPTAGKVKQRMVDVFALLFKGDLRQNYVMKPGDTLYVPPTFWAKATRVISPVTQPIGQAASTGATITTGIP